jgi:endonuclease YncB( thermonuclease family)
MRRIVLLLLLFPTIVLSDEAMVRVLKVHDGDTIVVQLDSKVVVARLKGIDCPEEGAGAGLRAKQYAAELIEGRNVKMKTFGKDKLGRTIVDVFLENGRLLNQELVLSGNCHWGRSRAMRP